MERVQLAAILAAVALLARVAGIELGITWSCLIVFGLSSSRPIGRSSGLCRDVRRFLRV